MLAINIDDSSQVAEARRAAAGMATAHGFDEQDAGRVALVTTELATNMLKHGGGGKLLVGSYEDASGAGVECLALDTGTGMSDIAKSLQDGHSTAGSPGTGLGAVRRGSHAMDIYSGTNLGTAVLARLQPGRPDPGRRSDYPDYGAVSIAMAGEEACGDTWCMRRDPVGFTVMVADGLGHGPLAAEAAHAASRSFLASPQAVPSMLLETIHTALRPTRGAAIGIARVDRGAGEVSFAGVGNIAASLIASDGGVRRMVSNNGTVGLNARRIRDFRYPLESTALMILASDGIGTSWRLDAYPGLSFCHPTVIAGVLYRDFNRGRDDATVHVSKLGPE